VLLDGGSGDAILERVNGIGLTWFIGIGLASSSEECSWIS
jgi:hypothetical protein